MPVSLGGATPLKICEAALGEAGVAPSRKSVARGGRVAFTGGVASVRFHPPEQVAAGPVVLRRLRAEEADAVAAAVAASMDHLRPWMAWATPEATDPAKQRVRILDAEALWEAGADFIYSVQRPQTGDGGAVGDFLGTIGLHRRIGPGAIEMGYWIHASHAGRGYGTAAARALTTVALALPNVQRVEIHCDLANAASAAIPRRLGYRLDRIEEHEPVAAADTGRQMIWVKECA